VVVVVVAVDFVPDLAAFVVVVVVDEAEEHGAPLVPSACVPVPTPVVLAFVPEPVPV
jgi:hypothetical protein